MHHRRHQHGLPSGRAEVELFSAWERELSDDVAEAGAPPRSPEPEDELSTAPLWWALCLATVFVLVALLA
jgi:hypothetical protein